VETINLAVDILLEKEPDLIIDRNKLKRSSQYATAESHFPFEGKIYDQVDGVSIGSPFSPCTSKSFHGIS